MISSSCFAFHVESDKKEPKSSADGEETLVHKDINNNTQEENADTGMPCERVNCGQCTDASLTRAFNAFLALSTRSHLNDKNKIKK